MLVRTLLALTPPPLARRLEGLMDTRDVSVFHAADTDEMWQLLQREDVDLLVAGDDAMGASAPDDWVAAVRALPEPPDLVLLTDREDPSRRAALLASWAASTGSRTWCIVAPPWPT